jgi:hypothetical protein
LLGHFRADALADLRELEHAGDEVDIINILWCEAGLLRGGHPAHTHVVGVLAGEVKNAAAFNLQLTEFGALTDR